MRARRERRKRVLVTFLKEKMTVQTRNRRTKMTARLRVRCSGILSRWRS